MAGYGWAGGCYGYHGGCYGGYGVIMVAPYYHGGCTGCYGAYGGYSCYGVPVPVEAIVPPRKEPAAKDPLPPIKDDKKEPEAVPLPKEKKTDDKKNDDKKAKGSARVHITVPEGGKLFVDGQHINVPAGTRVFQTPELSVGATFYYDIAIEVVRDGARQRHERRVLIRPGDEVAVDHEALGPSGTYTARVPR
jgi:uncharacterized protein (TIGR03000 family)